MADVAGTDSKKLANQMQDAEWYQATKDTILNLNTSSDTLVALFQEAATDGNEAKLQALNMFMGMRANVTSALSNLLRLMFESARSVIQNIPR